MVFWVLAVAAVLSSMTLASCACLCFRLLKLKIQATYNAKKPIQSSERSPSVVIPVRSPLPKIVEESIQPPRSEVESEPGDPEPDTPAPEPVPGPSTTPARWPPVPPLLTCSRREKEQRFLQGKVAEATLSILHRNDTLTVRITRIGKFHDIIRKQQAWVRVRNLKERLVSVAMKYSREVGELVGNEGVVFPNLPEASLCHTTLWFSLWSLDERGRQREYGNFALPCKELVRWNNLRSGFMVKYDFLMSSAAQTGPCLNLELRYSVPHEKIIVDLIDIQGLSSPRSGSVIIPSEVYVKLNFRNGKTGKKARFKTRHARGSSPIFNETFNFTALTDELNEVTLDIEVKLRKVRTETISVVRFGANAEPLQRRHWRKMVDTMFLESKGCAMLHPLTLRINR